MKYDRLKEIKSLVVGPHTYTILWDKLEGDGDYWGHCNHSKRRLEFSEALTGTGLVATFIHEIIHCINTVYNADKLTVGDKHYVCLLEVAVIKLLQDNPQLVLVLSGAGSGQDNKECRGSRGEVSRK